MFDDDAYDTRLRTPELGLNWGEKFSSREKVVQNALDQAKSNISSLQRHPRLSDDDFNQATKNLQISGGADQIQFGDSTPQGRGGIFIRDGTCGCNWCSRSNVPIPMADWTYGWKIRATCHPVSAKRAREIIGEICDLTRGRDKSLYLESHFERREHPEHFFVAQDPNQHNGSLSRRGMYSTARNAAVLISVADEETSIMHACISIKCHNGCRLSIRTEDVIFFLTKKSKKQVAFYYHDEYTGRSVFYNNNAAGEHVAYSSSEEEFGDY